jgi:parallel beta-helix repeat protein
VSFWHRGALAAAILSAGACDGGDRPDLTEAVAASELGGILQLEAGNYVLTGSLILDRPISIIGAADGTTIEVRFEEREPTEDRHAIQIRSDGISLAGLEITTTDSSATLVEVAAGSLELSDVRIVGGRVGVEFSEDGAGKVRDCWFADSQFGLIVAGSSVEIENTELTRHQDGIVFDAMSTATAQGNTVSDSSNNGMLVQADAQPLIVGNTLTGNGGGIAFYEGGRGTASDNTVTGNIWGIDVRSRGPVALIGNRLDGNDVAIQFWIDAGAGEVQGNLCSGDGLGIVLAGPIEPDVATNECATSTGPPFEPQR